MGRARGTFAPKFVQGSFRWNTWMSGQTWPLLSCTLCKECTTANQQRGTAESVLTSACQRTTSLFSISLGTLTCPLKHWKLRITNHEAGILVSLLLARNTMPALIRCHYLCLSILLSAERQDMDSSCHFTGNGQRQPSVNRKSKCRRLDSTDRPCTVVVSIVSASQRRLTFSSTGDCIGCK